jgi:broad specificity phosphatase PhoE
MQYQTNTQTNRTPPQVQWRALDEIDAGVCDGLTYGQIAQRHPEEYAARKADKLRYRWGGGRYCLGACSTGWGLLKVECVAQVESGGEAEVRTSGELKSPNRRPEPIHPNAKTKRYPRGESYLDMIQRLEPVMLEMEREGESLVVVSHQAVLRVILG